MTFLARGVCGSLPMVTMSGPAWTIFSTSRRILRRSMSRFFRTLAATPVPSLTRPSRMCSVPMYSWLKRWASWLASCITLRARSVKRSYIAWVLSGCRVDCAASAALPQSGGGGNREKSYLFRRRTRGDSEKDQHLRALVDCRRRVRARPGSLAIPCWLIPPGLYGILWPLEKQIKAAAMRGAGVAKRPRRSDTTVHRTPAALRHSSAHAVSALGSAGRGGAV